MRAEAHVFHKPVAHFFPKLSVATAALGLIVTSPNPMLRGWSPTLTAGWLLCHVVRCIAASGGCSQVGCCGSQQPKWDGRQSWHSAQQGDHEGSNARALSSSGLVVCAPP